jgi:hypothetical protein
MQTIKDLKKKMIIGQTMTLLQFGSQAEHKYLNVPRKIILVNSKSVKFTLGSWLDFPTREEVEFISENEIVIRYKEMKHIPLRYKIGE